MSAPTAPGGSPPRPSTSGPGVSPSTPPPPSAGSERPRPALGLRSRAGRARRGRRRLHPGGAAPQPAGAEGAPTEALAPGRLLLRLAGGSGPGHQLPGGLLVRQVPVEPHGPARPPHVRRPHPPGGFRPLGPPAARPTRSRAPSRGACAGDRRVVRTAARRHTRAYLAVGGGGRLQRGHGGVAPARAVRLGPTQHPGAHLAR